MPEKKLTLTATRDFRLRLQAELLKRCKTNPAYSMRAFAKHLGLEPSYLSKVLSRKRAVTPNLIKKLSPKLGLDDEGMAPYLKDDSTVPFHDLSDDQYEMLANWYHTAILELLCLPHFDESPGWIAKRLGILSKDARNAIERLLRLGILIRNEDGKLENPKGSYTTVGNPRSTQAFRVFQKQILKQAMDAMDETPVEFRDQSTITIAMDTSLIPEAKERIKKFRRKLSDFLQSSGKPMNEVYQVSISFFPVTKSKNLKISLALLGFLYWCSLAPTLTFAGGQETHGAGVAEFKNSSGQITKVELYDLYEADQVYHIPSADFGTIDENAILQKIYTKIESAYGNVFRTKLEAEVNLVKLKMIYQTDIPSVKDAHSIVYDANCSYQQLAVWEDATGKILVKKPYFDLLSPRDRAGLYLHEALYFFFRSFWQEKTSDHARLLNESFFSNSPSTDIGNDLLIDFLSTKPGAAYPWTPAGLESEVEEITSYTQQFQSSELWFQGSLNQTTVTIRALEGSITLDPPFDGCPRVLAVGNTCEIKFNQSNTTFVPGQMPYPDAWKLHVTLYSNQGFSVLTTSNQGSGTSVYYVEASAADPTSSSRKYALIYTVDLIQKH